MRRMVALIAAVGVNGVVPPSDDAMNRASVMPR